jgi:hypothetical protein
VRIDGPGLTESEKFGIITSDDRIDIVFH